MQNKQNQNMHAITTNKIKINTMKIHATQPKKDDRELAEMGTKNFSGNLL